MSVRRTVTAGTIFVAALFLAVPANASTPSATGSAAATAVTVPGPSAAKVNWSMKVVSDDWPWG